jgi:CheY-like chemotaxis protein
LFTSRLFKPVRQAHLVSQLVAALRGGSTRRNADDAASAQKPARPLRILLAEDNVMNQRITLLFLEKLGLRADIVADGAEAVSAVERQNYDVVLMDVQMPHMDGLEAARIISSRVPAPRRPHMIAMTAHALAGDRERCLGAGMNDYLNKPLDLAALEAALERMNGKSAAPGETVDLGRFVVLNTERLAIFPTEAFLRDMVQMLGQGSKEDMAAMRAAIRSGDAGGLEQAAHRLKSTYADLGGERAARLCQEIENHGRRGDLAGAGALLTALEKEAGALERALAAHIGA